MLEYILYVHNSHIHSSIVSSLGLSTFKVNRRKPVAKGKAKMEGMKLGFIGSGMMAQALAGGDYLIVCLFSSVPCDTLPPRPTRCPPAYNLLGIHPAPMLILNKLRTAPLSCSHCRLGFATWPNASKSTYTSACHVLVFHCRLDRGRKSSARQHYRKVRPHNTV